MNQNRRKRIHSRLRLAGVAVLGGLLLTLSLGFSATSGPTKPNIVAFLCDDLGLLDCTPYGATDVHTPNLDRLAKKGMVFDRAFIASPACAPSRAVMLCGLMPARNGAEANHTYARPEVRGWPSYLRDLGYDTAAFGKVAHGNDVKRWGFSHFELKFDLKLVKEYVANRSGDKPLCLFVGTHDPHVPWDKNREYDPAKVKLPWNFVDTPETRQYRTDYYTEVTRADADMGTLYDYVCEKLGTNTLFLFSSDHGAQWPFGKWNLYETSIRTPLLAAWPGVVKPGSRSEAMVSWVDFTPTLIELAGGTPPPGLDGKSFAGVLLGRSQTHREEVFTTHSGDGRMNVFPIRALRTERFKYLHNLHPQYEHTTWIDRAKDPDGLYYWRTWVAAAKTNPGASAIVQRYHQRPEEELYDLATDPEEKSNLAADSRFATTLETMRAKVDAWMKEQGDRRALFDVPYPLGTPELEQVPVAATNIPQPGAQLDSRRANVPNLLFIVGDDMGYADVGFHGCTDIPTPNLDALAAAGVRFTSGYVSGPYCSPTRAGLLTGRYQTRFGHEFNPGGGATGLPLSERTIADRLKTAGYATALVGKWHLGSQEAMHPQKRGFEDFFGFLAGAHSYFNAAGVMRGTEPVKDLDYTTDAFGREAASFIDQHKRGGPWFLYLAFNAVHTPMHATPERLTKFAGIADPQRRAYAAMMSAMDDAIGVVRRKLVETGQEQTTLVAFISDNGGPTMPGTTVNGSRNAPFRGSKRTTLEGGIHVPFLLAWPGHLKPGVFHHPVIQLDLTATALAAAGLETRSDPKLEGVDLLPFLTGSQAGVPHDALYWRFGQQMAIRAGDFKLVRYDSNADTRTGARRQPVTAPKLYNLANDLGETNDLAAAMPEKAKELQAKWQAWNQANIQALWGNPGGDSDGPEPGAPTTEKRKRKAATK